VGSLRVGQIRAVVVGAGIAGLVAARVLADRVDEVVIVERDRLAGGDGFAGGEGPRSGTPQAAHVHVLLRRGFLELTRLFPEFDARLAAAGALEIDWTRDLCTITPGGIAPRFASGIFTRAASRALVERTLRELVAAQDGVRIMDRTEVVGLLGDAGEVRGVRVRTRETLHRPSTGAPAGPASGAAPVLAETAPIPAETAPAELAASLVVDASGRASRFPDMLAALGVPAPTESVLDASLAYATRIYRAPADAPDWKLLIVRDTPPSGTRGGVVFPIEGGRWVVTLGGAGADRPPSDETGFEAFARSLIHPALAEALRRAEPVSPVRGWARTANRLRRVDRATAWPAGFAALGDAVCALNPVYGQGMSVAALEGQALARWLRSAPVSQALASDRPPDVRPLLHDLARATRVPWLMATSEDARVLGLPRAPDGGRLAGALGGYLKAVQDHSARDAFVLRRFVEVMHLLRTPTSLLDPRIMARVALARDHGPKDTARGTQP